MSTNLHQNTKKHKIGRGNITRTGTYIMCTTKVFNTLFDLKLNSLTEYRIICWCL